MDTKVVDVPERGRFEVRVDDRVVGLASYHVDGNQMTLPHTEVDPSVGGQGIGTALVAGVQSRGSRTNTGTTAPSAPAASTAASSAGWSASRRSRRNHSSDVGTRGA